MMLLHVDYGSLLVLTFGKTINSAEASVEGKRNRKMLIKLMSVYNFEDSLKRV